MEIQINYFLWVKKKIQFFKKILKKIITKTFFTFFKVFTNF